MPSVSIPAAIGTAIAGGLADVGVGVATAGIIGSVAGPAIAGAGIGALGSAITGGDPGQGALFGGLSGGALGGLGAAFPETMSSIGLGAFTPQPFATPTITPGVFGGAAGAVDAATGLDAATAAAYGIPFNASSATGGGGNILSSIFGGASGAQGALNPLSSFSNTDLALGALSGLGSAFSRPTMPNYGIAPGPATTAATQGPLFNKPLQTTGYLNRTPVQDYQPAGGSWYTYGEQGGGQPQFFNNNKLYFARGGALDLGRPTMLARGSPRGHVRGGGDGQSDSIPARLSSGEYVLTSADVSRIGGGDSEAGARKLDKMRGQIAKDAGARKFQGKVKEPISYLRRAGAR